LSADYAFANPPYNTAAQQRKCCADRFICRRIFRSFAGEDFARVHAVGTFEHGFSHRGETIVRLSAFALRYPIGWDDFITKRISRMTKSIPTLAAALLMTAIATPVLAQAAIQEPGAFAFYHPDADVLGGRPAYRSFDQSNAYYVDAVPMRDQRQIAPRHHRKAR